MGAQRPMGATARRTGEAAKLSFAVSKMKVKAEKHLHFCQKRPPACSVGTEQPEPKGRAHCGEKSGFTIWQTVNPALAPPQGRQGGPDRPRAPGDRPAKTQPHHPGPAHLRSGGAGTGKNAGAGNRPGNGERRSGRPRPPTAQGGEAPGPRPGPTTTEQSSAGGASSSRKADTRLFRLRPAPLPGPTGDGRRRPPNGGRRRGPTSGGRAANDTHRAGGSIAAPLWGDATTEKGDERESFERRPPGRASTRGAGGLPPESRIEG